VCASKQVCVRTSFTIIASGQCICIYGDRNTRLDLWLLVLTLCIDHVGSSRRLCLYAKASYHSLEIAFCFHCLFSHDDRFYTVYEPIQLQSVQGSADLQRKTVYILPIPHPSHDTLLVQCRWWVLWEACDCGVARLPHAPFASEIT